VNRILILGGGCGGLSTAQALRFAPVQVTLIDRASSHLFPSRLYAAAVGSAEPNKLQVSREMQLGGQKNVELIAGDAVYLDAKRRRLVLADGALPYDILVVAAGSRPRYGREEWQRYAPSLKSAEDAARIRDRLHDSETSLVVVGGGVAGVELAAAAARLDRAREVILVEEGPRILAEFPEALAKYAAEQLAKLGVDIRCQQLAIGVDEESVRLSTSKGRVRIATRAVGWAGGVKGSDFGSVLQRETGVPLDEGGRVCVNPDLTIAGHPEIFVIGDLARVMHDGLPLVGLATVASQQARYVASAIRERLSGYDATPFQYVDQGRFAILGRGGIGILGDSQLRGTTAWLAAKLAQRWSTVRNPFQFYSASAGSRT
jgi:NADH:ubiquinone reductase (H+-translocating)